MNPNQDLKNTGKPDKKILIDWYSEDYFVEQILKKVRSHLVKDDFQILKVLESAIDYEFFLTKHEILNNLEKEYRKNASERLEFLYKVELISKTQDLYDKSSKKSYSLDKYFITAKGIRVFFPEREINLERLKDWTHTGYSHLQQEVISGIFPEIKQEFLKSELQSLLEKYSTKLETVKAK